MQIDPSRVQWDDAPPATPAAAPATSPKIDVAAVKWDDGPQAPTSSQPTALPKIDPSAVKWDDGPEVSAPNTSAPAAPLPSAGAPAPSLADQAARGLGIGTRGVVQGLVDLPAMVSDNLIAKPLNAAADLVAGKGNGPRLKMAGESVNDLMTRAGVPEAQTSSERVIENINRGAAGAVSTMGAGAAAAANAAGTVARTVGSQLMASPLTQAASGATSGAASSLVRENGGSEGAQLAAGLVGGLAPAVGSFATKAAVRGAVRGGEAGREQMVANIKTFEDAAGIAPTLGQATQSRAIQAAETGLSNVPGGSGLMNRRGEAQAKALQDSVQEVTNSLAPNATGWGAGEAIAKGVNAFKDNVKTTQTALYRKLDEYIPASTPVQVDRTKAALASLNEGIDGAPNLSRFFKNAKIGSIEQSFLRDLDNFSQGNVPAGMRGMGVAETPGQLPYQAVQKLRTLVGQEISDSSLVSDVPRSKWRALYAALSDDLGGAAQAAGPQAEQAWSRANQYTRASIQRMEQLESVVNRDAPEKIFKAATSGMSDGGTQITRIMKSMPLENRREVAAAVLQRLGRARNSTQNEMGEAFSSEAFLTNLAAMSPPARMALFMNSGMPGLRSRIEQMGRMASLRREGAQVFANPSGTARQAGMFGWVSSLLAGLSTGNAAMLAGSLALPVMANAGAKIATSPAMVRYMARRSSINPATPAITINSAVQSSDTEEPIYSSRLKAEVTARKQGGKAVRVDGGWAVR